MYQAATIDTSQITPVTTATVTSQLPEVPVGAVATTPPLTPVTPTAFTTTGETLNQDDAWPTTEQMAQELMESGITNPELGIPLAVTPPVTLSPTPRPPLDPVPVIPLANTAMHFERPTAEYLLHQTGSPGSLPYGVITSLIGVILLVGVVGSMYLHLINQGMTQSEIIETALDSLPFTR